MTKKIYALIINGQFYDAHDNLESCMNWHNEFKTAIDANKIPHRWFSRFITNGKLSSIKMEVLEFNVAKGKNILEKINN